MLYPKDVIVLASRQNAEKIDTAIGNRPVRTIPDVGPGIVWNRRVYPLYLYNDEPIIFSDDESFEKSICSIVSNVSRRSVPCWNKLGETNDDWWIESQFYGHYVVFNGDEDRAIQLSRLLETKDFRVIRFARSFRPAANGTHYGWFIRVDKDEDPDRLSATVTKFFDGGRLNAYQVDDEVDHWIRKIGGFLVEEGFLDQIPGRAELLRVDLFLAIWESIRDRQAKLDELDCELDLLRIERQQERKKTKYKLAEQQDRLDQTLKELQDLKDAQGVGVAHSQALEKKIQQLEGEKSALEEDAEILYELLEKAETEAKQKASCRPRTRDSDFMEVVAICNPSLAIDEDSMECLLKEFSCRDGVLKNLALIQANKHKPPIRLRGKSGQAGWMKYDGHIKDGHKSMGRIYLRESRISDISFELVIHKKKDDKEQSRFIDALASRPPLESQSPYLR